MSYIKRLTSEINHQTSDMREGKDFLRWLDWIFLGGYLPSLNINYVAMSKDREKRLPQLYYRKAILTIGLNLSSLGPIDLIRGKFYVASCRAQFLDLFCLLFALMISLMSLVSLNHYRLLMTQVSFLPIKMPTTSFLLLTMNLQK